MDYFSLAQLRWVGALAAGCVIGVPLMLVALARGVWKGGFQYLCTGFRERPIPAASLDARWGTHRWVVANGLRFHVVEKGDPSKPLLLALHGFPESWWCYRLVLEAFAHTHHVVVPDMRGYGESDKPSATWAGSRSYAVRHLVDDVSAIATAVGHAGKPICLVGHDWGVRGCFGGLWAYGQCGRGAYGQRGRGAKGQCGRVPIALQPALMHMLLSASPPSGPRGVVRCLAAAE